MTTGIAFFSSFFGHTNTAESGCRPLHSLTPIIVWLAPYTILFSFLKRHSARQSATIWHCYFGALPASPISLMALWHFTGHWRRSPMAQLSERSIRCETYIVMGVFFAFFFLLPFSCSQILGPKGVKLDYKTIWGQRESLEVVKDSSFNSQPSSCTKKWTFISKICLTCFLT